MLLPQIWSMRYCYLKPENVMNHQRHKIKIHLTDYYLTLLPRTTGRSLARSDEERTPRNPAMFVERPERTGLMKQLTLQTIRNWSIKTTSTRVRLWVQRQLTHIFINSSNPTRRRPTRLVNMTWHGTDKTFSPILTTNVGGMMTSTAVDFISRPDVSSLSPSTW